MQSILLLEQEMLLRDIFGITRKSASERKQTKQAIFLQEKHQTYFGLRKDCRKGNERDTKNVEVHDRSSYCVRFVRSWRFPCRKNGCIR